MLSLFIILTRLILQIKCHYINISFVYYNIHEQCVGCLTENCYNGLDQCKSIVNMRACLYDKTKHLDPLKLAKYGYLYGIRNEFDYNFYSPVYRPRLFLKSFENIIDKSVVCSNYLEVRDSFNFKHYDRNSQNMLIHSDFTNKELSIFLFLHERYCRYKNIDGSCLRLSNHLQLKDHHFQMLHSHQMFFHVFMSKEYYSFVGNRLSASIALIINLACNSTTRYYGPMCLFECVENHRRFCSEHGEICKENWYGVYVKSYYVINGKNVEYKIFSCIFFDPCKPYHFCIRNGNESIFNDSYQARYDTLLRATATILMINLSVSCITNFQPFSKVSLKIKWLDRSPSIVVNGSLFYLKDDHHFTDRINMVCMAQADKQFSIKRTFQFEFCETGGTPRLIPESNDSIYYSCDLLSCGMPSLSDYTRHIVELYTLNSNSSRGKLISTSNVSMTIPLFIEPGRYILRCIIDFVCNYKFLIDKDFQFQIKHYKRIEFFPESKSFIGFQGKFGCKIVSQCLYNPIKLEMDRAWTTVFYLSIVHWPNRRNVTLYGINSITFAIDSELQSGDFNFQCCLAWLNKCKGSRHHVAIRLKLKKDLIVMPEMIFQGDRIYCYSIDQSVSEQSYLVIIQENFTSNFTRVYTENVVGLENFSVVNRLLDYHCSFFGFYKYSFINYTKELHIYVKTEQFYQLLYYNPCQWLMPIAIIMSYFLSNVLFGILICYTLANTKRLCSHTEQNYFPRLYLQYVRTKIIYDNFMKWLNHYTHSPTNSERVSSGSLLSGSAGTSFYYSSLDIRSDENFS